MRNAMQYLYSIRVSLLFKISSTLCRLFLAYKVPTKNKIQRLNFVLKSIFRGFIPYNFFFLFLPTSYFRYLLCSSWMLVQSTSNWVHTSNLISFCFNHPCSQQNILCYTIITDLVFCLLTRVLTQRPIFKCCLQCTDRSSNLQSVHSTF